MTVAIVDPETGEVVASFSFSAPRQYDVLVIQTRATWYVTATGETRQWRWEVKNELEL